MKKHKLFILAFAIILMLQACASAPRQAPMDINSFVLQAEIPLRFAADKVLYNAQSQITLAFSSKNQEVHLFKGSEKLNVIGGLGANFTYLSDIALGQDGSLFVLDSATRSVRKFSLDGKVMGNLELKGSIQPTLITVQSDQNLFVYDAGPGEIVCYSILDGTEQYRFGRFQLAQISSLACNRDYLLAYRKDENSSSVFSILGQLVKSEEGQVVYDEYNNGISYQKGGIISLSSAAFLPLRSDPKLLGIDRDILVLGFEETVRLFKINYLRLD